MTPAERRGFEQAADLIELWYRAGPNATDSGADVAIFARVIAARLRDWASSDQDPREHLGDT